MFDIGFAEILLVAVIGLMVLGPDKLPEAIRTGSLWLGRLKRGFNDIKADIEREIGADEIRQQLQNETLVQDIKDAGDTLKDIHKQVNNSTEALLNSANDEPVKENTPPEHNAESARA